MGGDNWINASNVNSGRDTKLNLTVNNYHLTKLPIVDIKERREKFDRALLSKLWGFVNSKYIEKLDDQTQRGMIDYDEYIAHIYEYLELRREVQNKFHNSDLEIAFEGFDKALKQYGEKVRPAFTTNKWGSKDWYMSEEREAKLIDHHPLTEEQYQIVQSRFNQVIEQSTALLKQSKQLTIAIRDIAPDFFVD